MNTHENEERRISRFAPEPGRVYRTRDLAAWTANPTRVAKRMVARGELAELAQGLYACPRRTRFGEAPPTPEAILDAFLDHDRYVFTGPEYWNALGLGSTAVFPARIVYNRKRSGEFSFGGQRFLLRRVKLPDQATREWYAVDLIEHRAMVGLDTGTLARRLRDAARDGRLDPARLREAAREHGTRRTQRLVDEALRSAEAA